MSSQDIITLREETGAGVMDCKKALEEANGNLEEAKKIIFSKGAAKAEKKSERKTGAGILEAYVHNRRIGVLVEVRCETDFVARNDEFRSFARDVAMQIASMAPEDVEALLAQPFIKDESVTIGDMLTRMIAKIGENMKIERFCRYEL